MWDRRDPELLDSEPLAGTIPDDVSLISEERRKYSGRPMPHVEARDIVTGRATVVADIRIPGMARGAIGRPPARGAKLRSLADTKAPAMPGDIAVVRQDDVVGVVAERGEQARAAAAAVETEWHVIPIEGPTAEVT